MTDAGSGRQYYVNRSTGATQWHAPDGVDFAAADQVLAEMAEQPMRNALDREGGNVESQEVKTADGAGGGDGKPQATRNGGPRMAAGLPKSPHDEYV